MDADDSNDARKRKRKNSIDDSTYEDEVEKRKQKRKEYDNRYREKHPHKSDLAKQANKDYCKRYRDKRRTLNLLSTDQTFVQQSVPPQIAGPSTRDVPYVPPTVIHSSQIAGPSTRDVPYIPRTAIHSSAQLHIMNWTDQNCLILIEKYRAHECLWNPSDPAYRMSSTKSAAWKQIGDDLDLPQEEVKKKINSLLASFRRERAKDGRLMALDVGRRKIYHSKWFAFKHMNFLLDRCFPAKNAEGINDMEDENDTEFFFNTREEVFENSDSQDNNVETDIFENLTCSDVFNSEQTQDNEVEDVLPKKRPKVHYFEEDQMELDTKVQRQVMDWSDTNSLLLIEEYRAHECLWNPADVAYRMLSKKAVAWREIADRFDVRQEEIKKKMNSLLASFRRERAKEGTKILELGRETFYKSRWFAFKPMGFLMCRFNQNKIKQAEETNKNNTEIEGESDMFFNIKDEMLEVSEIEIKDWEPDVLENLSTSSIVSPHEPSPEIEIDYLNSKRSPKLHKLKKFRKNGTSTDNFVEMCKVPSTEKSVVDAFGEYVVVKLKEYDSYVRNTIQHKISEIFFQADRGCFDNHSQTQ